MPTDVKPTISDKKPTTNDAKRTTSDVKKEVKKGDENIDLSSTKSLLCDPSALSLVKESVRIRQQAVLDRKRARLLEYQQEMDVLSQQLAQMNPFCYQKSTERVQESRPDTGP